MELAVKKLPGSAGDVKDAGSIPGSGRFPEEGNDYPLQYSCLENSMDRGAWQATVHGAAKSWRRLRNEENVHVLIWANLSDTVSEKNKVENCI